MGTTFVLFHWIFLLGIFAYILWHLFAFSDVSQKSAYLSLCVTFAACFTVFEGLLAFIEWRKLTPGYTVLYICNLMYNVSAAVLSLSWRLYVYKALDRQAKFLKPFVYTFALLDAAVILVYLFCPDKRLFVSYAEDGSVVYGQLDYLWYIVEYIPFVGALISSILAYASKKNYAYREGYKPLIFLSAILMIVSILQIVFDESNLLGEVLALAFAYLLTVMFKVQISQDSLTKLDNKRRFLRDADIALRYDHKSKLSLVMIDMDLFKNINDSCGHMEGDSVLASFGELLYTSCNSQNIRAYRFGGDEFALLCRDVDDDFVEKFMQNVSEKSRSLISGSGVTHDVGFSYGIMSISGKQKYSLPQLVKLADDKLYEMKAEHHSKAEGKL